MEEQVIWRRPVDQDRIDRRNQRFLRWFVVPAVLIIVVLVLSRSGAAGPITFVLGIIGLAIGLWVRFSTLNDRLNPTMSVIDGAVVVGDRKVAIDDVLRYTTVATNIATTVGGRGRIALGRAAFLINGLDERGKPGPELVEFGWPNMDGETLETVKSALDSVLPGMWVEPDEIRE